MVPAKRAQGGIKGVGGVEAVPQGKVMFDGFGYRGRGHNRRRRDAAGSDHPQPRGAKGRRTEIAVRGHVHRDIQHRRDVTA